jgi:two-component system, chemotaxis family, sensor kinase Cph1
VKSIIEFIKGLFDTDLWPARWHCGYWSHFHGWLYIISDLLIWLAYFMIPVIIFSYVSKRKQVIKYSGIYLLFAAFILLCGSTHFLDASMFWVPMYRLNALVRFLTAIVSLLTVYYLIKILPEAFTQKTSMELEKEINRRQLAELKLSDTNKSLEAFAYVASHDLQEPLRKIKTFASMLYEVNAKGVENESKYLTQKIMMSTERMQTLIGDLLNLSTIVDEIEFSQVNIKQVIENVMEDLEIRMKEKNVKINVGDIPNVKGNKGYLTQLFMNLISNGIKFNTGQPVITISGEKVGSVVFIQVFDNGIGIEEKNISKIFDVFSRLNAKSDFEGSGIGLAICKKIVSIHQGSILVKSVFGNGTSFTMSLPADD